MLSELGSSYNSDSTLQDDPASAGSAIKEDDFSCYPDLHLPLSGADNSYSLLYPELDTPFSCSSYSDAPFSSGLLFSRNDSPSFCSSASNRTEDRDKLGEWAIRDQSAHAPLFSDFLGITEDLDNDAPYLRGLVSRNLLYPKQLSDSVMTSHVPLEAGAGTHSELQVNLEAKISAAEPSTTLPIMQMPLLLGQVFSRKRPSISVVCQPLNADFGVEDSGMTNSESELGVVLLDHHMEISGWAPLDSVKYPYAQIAENWEIGLSDWQDPETKSKGRITGAHIPSTVEGGVTMKDQFLSESAPSQDDMPSSEVDNDPSVEIAPLKWARRNVASHSVARTRRRQNAVHTFTSLSPLAKAQAFSSFLESNDICTMIGDILNSRSIANSHGNSNMPPVTSRRAFKATAATPLSPSYSTRTQDDGLQVEQSPAPSICAVESTGGFKSDTINIQQDQHNSTALQPSCIRTRATKDYQPHTPTSATSRPQISDLLRTMTPSSTDRDSLTRTPLHSRIQTQPPRLRALLSPTLARRITYRARLTRQEESARVRRRLEEDMARLERVEREEEGRRLVSEFLVGISGGEGGFGRSCAIGAAESMDAVMSCSVEGEEEYNEHMKGWMEGDGRILHNERHAGNDGTIDAGTRMRDLKNVSNWRREKIAESRLNMILESLCSTDITTGSSTSMKRQTQHHRSASLNLPHPTVIIDKDQESSPHALSPSQRRVLASLDPNLPSRSRRGRRGAASTSLVIDRSSSPFIMQIPAPPRNTITVHPHVQNTMSEAFHSLDPSTGLEDSSKRPSTTIRKRRPSSSFLLTLDERASDYGDLNAQMKRVRTSSDTA